MADEEVKEEAEKIEEAAAAPATENAPVPEEGDVSQAVEAQSTPAEPPSEAAEPPSEGAEPQSEAEPKSEATEAQGEAAEVHAEAVETEIHTEQLDIPSEVPSERQGEEQSEMRSLAGEEKKETGEEETGEDNLREAKQTDEPVQDDDVSSSESSSKEEEEFSPLGPVVSSLMTGSDEEEEEEEMLSITKMSELKLLTEPIDREAYIEEYKNLLLEQTGTIRKNSFLSYKLSMYFKKKKLDESFQEMENVEEMQAKYEKKLDEMYLMKEKAHRDQTTELEDIKYMTESYAEQTQQREEEFRTMQKRERDIGKGLIDTRIGKVISEKQVERLIKRQYAKAEEISEVRLKYIRRKDKVKNLENQLRTLETIDGQHHLIEYEQLRMENHNLSDKIEERDEELRKLRIRYDTAVQMLAHMREKSSNTGTHIDDLELESGIIEDELSSKREFVNNLKVQRDFNRAEAMKLKDESGLLTCTNLLIDMEKRWDELDDTRNELISLKQANKSRRMKLEAIRKNIEYNTEKGLVQVKPVKQTRKSGYSNIYRGRPSLLEPKIDSQITLAKLNEKLEEENE